MKSFSKGGRANDQNKARSSNLCSINPTNNHRPSKPGRQVKIFEYLNIQMTKGASNTCLRMIQQHECWGKSSSSFCHSLLMVIRWILDAANQAKVRSIEMPRLPYILSKSKSPLNCWKHFSGFIIPHKYGAPLVLRNTNLVCWYISTFHCSAATPACFVALLRQSQRRHS